MVLLFSMLLVLFGGLLIQHVPSKWFHFDSDVQQVDQLSSSENAEEATAEINDSKSSANAESNDQFQKEDLGSRTNIAVASPEVDLRFKQAVAMLHARRYEYAFVTLSSLLEVAPEMPEAHVNMGFALLGMGRPEPAYESFVTATELRPTQANAYYGMAMALEAIGEMEGAMGAMRTYLHLEKDGDEKHLMKAQSALWEWEARSGRGPWGETRGVPPGYTADQIKRDPELDQQEILVEPSNAISLDGVPPAQD